MRILFVIHNISKTRHFDRVLISLAERGHTVILAVEDGSEPKALQLPKYAIALNRRLAADARGRSGRIELVAGPSQRGDAWVDAAPAFRRARDYVRYLHPDYAKAAKLRERSAANAPAGWADFLDRHRWLRRRSGLLQNVLALAEEAIPSDAAIDDFVRRQNPDLMLVTPLVRATYQTDYVKSAHRLGLPVGFLPFSWDNLTNGGLIRVQPDRILVWSEIQKHEAVYFHHTPPERVVITGAARFDSFFEMQPATTREPFCRELGLDPAAPLLLYLCSSKFVAPREVDFVRRWIGAIRECADPLVRGASLLVRPHPAHQKQWKDGCFGSERNVALSPVSQTMNADQGLYDSIFHSAAVVGLNTSALIEAGILGKPVYTILAGEFAGGQERTLHFKYLQASHGGLLHEASSFEDHLGQLTTAIRETGRLDRERRFIESFVRPHGLDRAVTPIMVEEIERIGTVAKRPRRQALWQRAVGRGLRWTMSRGA